MPKPELHVSAGAVAAVMMASVLSACHRQSPPTTLAMPPPLKNAANVTAERLIAADADQRLTPGRDANGTYFSLAAGHQRGQRGQTRIRGGITGSEQTGGRSPRRS